MSRFWRLPGEGKVLSAPTRLREAVIDPPEVTATTNAMPRVATVACGQRHCAAVTMNGVLLSWGNEEFGQLGQGPPRDSSSKGDTKSLIREGGRVDDAAPRRERAREVHFGGVRRRTHARADRQRPRLLSAGARSVLLDTGTDSIATFPDWWMRCGAWE